LPHPASTFFFPPIEKRHPLFPPWRIQHSRGSALVHIISFLTSSLEKLSICCGQNGGALLEDTTSSFVCRRGSSLRSFDSSLPLSEAAIHHLMQLPNLRCWVGTHEPPQTLPLDAFPSLEGLCLRTTAALPWLHLLVWHGKDSVREPGFTAATSHTNIRETLEYLECPSVTTIDSAF